MFKIDDSSKNLVKNIQELSIGIALTDGERNILEANDSFCNYLGYSSEELKGTTIDSITHPDDRNRTQDTFHVLLAGEGTDHAYEKRYICKDGTIVWSLTTLNFLPPDTPDGSPLVIGFVQDITHHKSLEEDLRTTKGLYQSLSENLGVGLCLIDKDFRIQMINSALAQMFHGKTREFIGKFCYEAFEKRFAPCPHCPGKKAVLTRQPQETITEGIDGYGRRFKVRLKSFPVLDAHGRPDGFVEMVEDLSTFRDMEMALHESEERFKALAEVAPIGIFEVNAKGENTYSNPAWNRMTGLSVQENLNQGWITAIHENDRSEVLRSWTQARSKRQFWRKEHRLRTRDGDVRWVQAMAVPVLDEGGDLLRYVGTIVDLTEQKAFMQQLSESEEKFRSIFDQSRVGMVVVNKEGDILDANQAFCAFAGLSLEEIKRLPLQSLSHPDEFTLTTQIQKSFQGRSPGSNFLRKFLRKDGKAVWGDVNCVWISHRGNHEGFCVCLIQDMTKKKEAQSRLKYLEHHDEMTGLPNKKLFGDRLSHAIAKAKRSQVNVAVLLVCLDRFSNIIGTFDHKIGNVLLGDVAQRLQENVRQTDTLSRIGDTEFVILLEDVKKLKTTHIVAQSILQRIAEPFMVEDQAIHLSASIGISLFPNDGDEPLYLLRNASAAMNRAKQQGGGTFEYFIPELNLRTRKHLETEAALRKAILKEEFILHYQPQIDLASRNLEGFEALIRWEHPEKGLISPGDFIPLAEESGVIVSIGEWVLRQVCFQGAKWQKEGLNPGRLSVNISPRQFRQRNLPHLLSRILEDTGFPPEQLGLEITESMVMDNVDGAIEIMEAIADMGVHLSIDDFGSGYSSLHYLKRFPVNRLKIDRSFVSEVKNDPNDAAIATAIVAMGKSLNLEVVAEGIETEEQYAFFRERNCDLGQGFLFSRPVDECQAKDLIRTHTL